MTFFPFFLEKNRNFLRLVMVRSAEKHSANHNFSRILTTSIGSSRGELVILATAMEFNSSTHAPVTRSFSSALHNVCRMQANYRARFASVSWWQRSTLRSSICDPRVTHFMVSQIRAGSNSRRLFGHSRLQNGERCERVRKSVSQKGCPKSTDSSAPKAAAAETVPSQGQKERTVCGLDLAHIASLPFCV